MSRDPDCGGFLAIECIDQAMHDITEDMLGVLWIMALDVLDAP